MPKGILFNLPTGMLSAVKNGTKTITRRLGGLEDVNEYPHQCKLYESPEEGIFVFRNTIHKSMAQICKPTYKVDEVLFLKESFRILYKGTRNQKVVYKSDFPVTSASYHETKWSNSMFCGEYDKETGIKIARTYIKVLSIRCERLHDISDSDCIKEGVQIMQSDAAGNLYRDYSQKVLTVKSPTESFCTLINVINGRNTWLSNPWVFRYSFYEVVNLPFDGKDNYVRKHE